MDKRWAIVEGFVTKIRAGKVWKSEHAKFARARAAEHGIYIPDPNEG